VETIFSATCSSKTCARNVHSEVLLEVASSTDNVSRQISEHIFAPSGGYCLHIWCVQYKVYWKVLLLFPQDVVLVCHKLPHPPRSILSAYPNISPLTTHGVLCKSLGRGVPLAHWIPYPILGHDQLGFQPYYRLGSKSPTLSQTSYSQWRNFITIVVQHMLDKPISYKVSLGFNFYYGTLGKETRSKLHYLYTDCKSNPTLDQTVAFLYPIPD